MGLFKPAWQSKKMVKRIKAINAIDDWGILRTLAIEDPCMPVIDAALNRLVALGCGDDMLVDIACNTQDVFAHMSLSKIRDPQSYLKILDMPHLHNAVAKYIFQHFDMVIIKNIIFDRQDQPIALSLIKLVQDAAFLAELSVNTDYNEDARKAARGTFASLVAGDFHTTGNVLKHYKGNARRVILPEHIRSIDEKAFINAAQVEELVLHMDVDATCLDAMRKIESLKQVSIRGKHSEYMVLDGVVYSSDGSTLLFFPPGKGREYLLPKEVTGIAETAYQSLIYACALEHVKVEAGNACFCAADGVLYHKDLSELVYCPSGKKGIVSLQPETCIIEDRAFRNCMFLEDVQLPKTDYGQPLCQIFEGCRNLNQQRFGHRFTEPIERNEYDYRDDDDMKSGVKSYTHVECTHCGQRWSSWMKNYPAQNTEPAFIVWEQGRLSKYEGKAMNVILPSYVKKLSPYAFKQAQGITRLELHAELLPEFILALHELESLEALEMRGEHPAYQVVDDVLYNKDMSELLFFPPRKSGYFTLPDTVKKIESKICEGIEQAPNLIGVNIRRENAYFYAEGKSVRKRVEEYSS